MFTCIIYTIPDAVTIVLFNVLSSFSNRPFDMEAPNGGAIVAQDVSIEWQFDLLVFKKLV